jgi:hypothetical protein
MRSMTREDLTVLINDAFADVPRPSDDMLVDWTRIEPREVSMVHVQENWSVEGRGHFDSIEVLTAWYGEDFNYFSREAVHYFLPGYMLFILTKPAATDLGGFDGTVEYLFRQCLDRRWGNCPEFTRPQRASISAWAGFIYMHLDEYDVNDAISASLDLVFGLSYSIKLQAIEYRFRDHAES